MAEQAKQIKSDTMNLYQKVNAISNEIGKIAKTGRNTNQGYGFIEQAIVVAIIKPLLTEYGVAIIPSVDKHQVMLKEKGAKIIVDITFTVVNTDKPDETIICHWVGEGDDSLDKGTNKALTAAQKYFYMKLFNISDKDDPDAEGKDLGNIKTEQTTAKPVAAQPVAAAVKTTTAAAPAANMLNMYRTYAAKLGKTVDEDGLSMLNAAEVAAAVNSMIKELKGKQ